MRTYAPRAALASRVRAIDIVETVGGESFVLPSTSAVLGIQFRGRVGLGDRILSPAGVTGIQTAARRYTYVGSTGSVLVRFTPEGAASLGVPAHDIAGESVALDDFLPASRASELADRLHAAPDDRARIALVEAFLLERSFVRDGVVGRALELLGGGTSVAAVARALGTSERQLERRFIARVGIAPKRFAKLERFERAIARARSQASLAAAAHAGGYYDQSHFIRDVRHFTGLSPGELLSLLSRAPDDGAGRIEMSETSNGRRAP